MLGPRHNLSSDAEVPESLSLFDLPFLLAELQELLAEVLNGQDTRDTEAREASA